MSSARTLALCAAAALLGGGCEPKTEPDARFVSIAEIKGFDPIFCNDQYSSGAQIQVFEGLTEFHYLKRPMELVPLLAEAAPQVSEDGLVYTFKIREAVFQDDPCFPGGKGRAVVAQDFVWCWKRLMADPSSTGAWIFEGKIKGIDEWTKKARERVRKPDLFDRVNEHYAVESPLMAPIMAEDIPGLRALDAKTLRVELTEPYPQFMWTTAMSFTVAYPREAVEHYGLDFMNHPVGTGAYRVEDYWVFDRKIVFVRNPTWHGGTYPTEGEPARGDRPSDKDLGLLEDAGKKLPFLDRIEFVTIVASSPRWLRFHGADLDRVETEKEIWAKSMTADGRLRPELAERGIHVQKEPMADATFTSFNMYDKVIGAPAGERGRKIRQAMCLAYDQKQWIDVMRNGFWAVPAIGPIPPGLAGYVDDVKSPYTGRDVARAKKLLEEAGYPGGRGLPTFSYEMNNSDAVTRTGTEIFRNCMKDIGIDVEMKANTWDQFDDKVKKKDAQIFGMAWGADYPDAQNFLQLFYGPNESPGPNNSNYKNPEYDRLYDEMKVMQPGSARDDVIRKMLRILNEDCPWNYTDHRIRYSYSWSWLKNFKYLDINPWLFKYYRIDEAEKARRATPPELRGEGR